MNLKSAFYQKNKIRGLAITDAPLTAVNNRQRLTDTMKNYKYNGSQVNGGTITCAINGPIDSIAIINSNLKSFTIQYDGNDFSVPISVADSDKTHYYFEFESVTVTNLVLSITATHTGSTPNIGYFFASEKIGEIDSYDGSIKVERQTIQESNRSSDGRQWATIISGIYSFNVNTKVKSDDNIFRLVYNNYFLGGQIVEYIHHYGEPASSFRGIMEKVLFSSNFQLGENYLGAQSGEQLFQEVKGKLIPAGAGE